MVDFYFMVNRHLRRTIIFGYALLLLFCTTQCQTKQTAATTASPVATATATPSIGVAFATLVPPTAVFVQTTPTPLPTATATPTPTPVVYTIEAGDTLLAIAWQGGNTVAEIEALNPGIVPERLQIGQQIVLPPPATPLAQQLAGTAVPLQMEVRQVQAYRTAVGSMWLLGEVWNESELPAENVQLAIELRDEAGVTLDTVTAWVAAPVVPAAAAAPFGVLIAEPPADFAYPVVNVAGGLTVTDLGTRYLDLAVTETAVAPAGAGVQVSGLLQNLGEATAANILLLCTLYDQDGTVRGFTQQWLAAPLAAGNSVSITLEAAPPGGQAVSAKLLAQAYIEDPTQ